LIVRAWISSIHIKTGGVYMKRISLLVIAAFIILTAFPAAAYDFKWGEVDLNFGGSAQLNLEWDQWNYGDVTPDMVTVKNETAAFLPSDNQLHLGARWKTIYGYGEVGLMESDKFDMQTRYAYLLWDMGKGFSMLAGQTDDMFSQDAPNERLMDNLNLTGYGRLYTERCQQLRFGWTNKTITAEFEVQRRKTSDPSDFRVVPYDDDNGSLYVVDNEFPAVAARVMWDFGFGVVKPSVYFQKYILRPNGTPEDPLANPLKNLHVNTFGVSFQGLFKMDPVTFTYGFWWGQNLNIFSEDKRGSNVFQVFGAPIADDPVFKGGDIKSVHSWGGWVQPSIKVGPGIVFLGGGYQQAQTRLPRNVTVSDGTNSYVLTTSKNIYTYSCFLNYEWHVLKGFIITPEVTYLDNGRDSVDQRVFFNEEGLVAAIVPGSKLGYTVLTGVHFQYDF
jgi:hypothetical protein